VEIRYYIDPETEQPHIYGHNIDEQDVEDVLAKPLEDRPGRDDTWVALGRTRAGRYLRVIYRRDALLRSVFVITVVRALRRRRKRKS
jgi:hypothetical protein